MTLSSMGTPALRCFETIPGKFIWMEQHGLKRFAWGDAEKPVGFWRAFLDTAERDAEDGLVRF